MTRDKSFYYQYSRLENKEKHTVVEIVFHSNISIVEIQGFREFLQCLLLVQIMNETRGLVTYIFFLEMRIKFFQELSLVYNLG